MNKYYVTWEEIFERLAPIDLEENVIYGIPKGGMLAAAFLKHAKVTHNPDEATIFLDDIVDSGDTILKYCAKYIKPWYALFDKITDKDDELLMKDTWIVFPWEKEHPAGEDTIQQNVMRVLQYIGEDVKREGLLDTPNRVAKMYSQIFRGYTQDPKDILTTFDVGTYDQIILLKDCELYSMCEHHMLPFFGKIHIAYIPNEKIVGISKLARLADIFSKRLQIQERIGEEITTCLMELLNAKGAACIIEANHMCMRMRGVEKQNSVMTTSSMKGIFMTDTSCRQELLQLIKM